MPILRKESESVRNGTDYSFWGYKRDNGRVGTRNYVAILPVDDISNAACEGVANNIAGTLALPHSYGRLQFGEDLELHFRTIIGIGANPNLAAVIVIGIEEGWTKKVVEGIAATGKPVTGYSIELNGDINTIAAASRKAQEYVKYASELRRELRPVSDLWVAVKCGESDTTSGLASNPTVGNLIEKFDAAGAYTCFGETSEITGAEQIVAKRAKTPEVGKKFMKIWQNYTDMIMQEKTSDLSESQPTKGNIAGGLTTIEEKALGNIQKIGKKASYIDVLHPAETPQKGAGLYYMDTSSAAAECVTLQAAGGYTLHLFPTGQGNVIGNPVIPVLKLSANPRTCRTMGEHIDVDVSGLLTGELNLDTAGDKLISETLRIASGRMASAETLRHKELVMTKLYRSA